VVAPEVGVLAWDFALLPHPQTAHSQVVQVQNSPLQSGHLQLSQAHDMHALAEVFLATQHECFA
jgi:hypothetical protein